MRHIPKSCHSCHACPKSNNFYQSFLKSVTHEKRVIFIERAIDQSESRSCQLYISCHSKFQKCVKSINRAISQSESRSCQFHISCHVCPHSCHFYNEFTKNVCLLSNHQSCATRVICGKSCQFLLSNCDHSKNCSTRVQQLSMSIVCTWHVKLSHFNP